jgi:hypothetical protein
LDEATQVRVAALKWEVGKSEPFHGLELGVIDIQGMCAIGVHDVPQRHICMPRGKANGSRAGNHQRRVDLVIGADAQFLSQLTRDR